MASRALLLHKLERLNFDTAILKWIQAYLLSRYQCVVLNSKTSNSLDVTSGVPQGSVLEPL